MCVIGFRIIRLKLNNGITLHYSGLTEDLEPTWVFPSEKAVWLQPHEVDRHMVIISSILSIHKDKLEVIDV